MRREHLGVFVGENGHWGFFREIFGDLAERYVAEVYERKAYRAPIFRDRLNRWANHTTMRSMLRRNPVCFFEWASELLVPASQLPKTCRIVTRLHCYEMFVWAPLVNWNHVDRVVFVSRAMEKKFKEIIPNQAGKTAVVYNGVALDRFTPATGKRFALDLGIVAEFRPVKRHYEAILAVYELKRRGYRPHLHIAGGRQPGGYCDDYFAAVDSLIRKLGLTDSVTLYDHVIDMPGWLSRIDLFISSGCWEGQQVALLEAMATGRYCLSHCWDGAEEVLPEAHLYTTESQLVEQIEQYSARSAVERRHSEEEMRTIAVERFDIERTKRQVREIVEQELEPARRLQSRLRAGAPA